MYQHDPDRAPDSDFVSGCLAHLVCGNSGRMLDHRRTPVCVVGVHPDQALFELEVMAFEDKGARWRIPMEMVERFQFVRDSTLAEAVPFEAAVARCDQALVIEADPSERDRTEAAIGALQVEAAAWLDSQSAHFAQADGIDLSRPSGEPLLYRDLSRWIAANESTLLETAFSTAWVSNPWPLGPVFGHRIVLAEMGLCSFVGKVVREPDLFSGVASREARAQHIKARLAFLRAVFARAGYDEVVLYRGMSYHGALRPPTEGRLVSSTFRRDLANAFFDALPEGSGVLYRQVVPVRRLFMTFVETEAMNRQFLESEALLLGESDNLAF